MAGQKGLPVVGRTCFYSREVSMCPMVRYKPFRQLSSLALDFGGEKHQTGGYVP